MDSEYRGMDLLSIIAIFVDETRDIGYWLHVLLGGVFITAIDTVGALDFTVDVKIVLNITK